MSGNIPKSWAKSSLENLVGCDGIFCDGDWIESKDQDPYGDVRLIQLADIGEGVFRNKSNRFLTRAKAKELGCTYIQENDVLIARMPDPLGRACIFPGSSKLSVTAVDVSILRAGTPYINQKYLMWFINTPQIRNDIAKLQSGSTRKRISRSNLAGIVINVPPILEQPRIVAKLEELFSDLDAGIAALERAKANLKRYRASVLKAAVEGKLTAEWRRQNPPKETGAELLARILKERRAKWEENQLKKFAEQGKTPPKNWRDKYPEPARADIKELPELPERWVWASLEEITERIADVDHKMPKPDDSEICYVSTRDFISTDGIDFEGAKKISREDFEQLCRKVRPENGDILLSRYGTVGLVRLIKTDRDFQASYSIAIIKTLKSIDIAPFLVIALRSEMIQKQIRRDVRATAQPDLGLAHIKLFAVALPSYSEQQEIIAEVERRLSIADATEKTITHALTRAARLRQAILKRAFEGRLVPQDPNDEPASELLKRIQAERATQAPAQRKPRHKTISASD